MWAWLARVAAQMSGGIARGLDAAVQRRAGLMLAAVLAAVALFLLPWPAPLLDLLLVVSLGLSIALCAAAVRAGEPARFPQLPSLLLVSVLLRLGLNIATLRAVLGSSGGSAAGRDGVPFLISGSGSLLFGGDYLVGALVVIAFAAVEYLVLARGGERVAEVAARFVLDALPGRQSAIEADLRAGSISQAQAAERRRALDREAQTYGALDGAVRLLRGDVVAALLLLSAGVIFGVLLGVLRHGLDVTEAAERYTGLVLSQALLTQVPVLLNAAAAALLLTRGGAQTDDQGRAAAPSNAAHEGDRQALVIEAAPALGLDGPTLGALATALSARLGFPVPPIVLRPLPAGAASSRTLTVSLFGARLSTPSLTGDGDARAVLQQTLLSAAPDLLTLDAVQAWLDDLQRGQPALVRETVPRRIDLGRLSALLRRLLSARVWPIDLRAVLEVLATLPKLDGDVTRLAEQVRGQLGRFLIHGFLRAGLSDGPTAGGGGLGDGLPALLMSTEIEALLRDTQRGGAGEGGRLEPDLARDIVQGALSAKRLAPDSVLLCQADVRPYVEELLSSTPEVLPVFAYSEVPSSVRVIVLGRVEPGGEHTAPVLDSSAVPWQLRSR